MSDSFFSQFQAFGISNRNELIISKEEIDNDNVSCDGETFLNSGTIENWVILEQ